MKHLSEIINEKLVLSKRNLSDKETILLLDTYHREYYDDDDYTEEQICAMIDDDIDNFMGMLDKADKNYKGYIVTSEFSSYNKGKRWMYPEHFEYLDAAYKKIISRADDVIVNYVDGSLEVTGLGHDGSNTLYISPLTNDGVDVFTAFIDGYDDDYFDGLDEYEFYKKFVNDKKMIKKFDLEKDFDY